MKKIIYYIIGILAAGAIVAITILSVALSATQKRCTTLNDRVKEQSKVIDSLLTKRDRFVDVELYVTDKSKSTIYGKYNKGNITMPQEKTYHLEIDSTNVTIK